MIASMTGFGRAEQTLETRKISVEIRCLNSKNLDLNARIHSFFRELEPEIRKTIGNQLSRGKIDLSIYLELVNGQSPTSINTEVVQNYIQQLQEIETVSPADALQMAIRLPDALKTEKETIDEATADVVKQLIQKALTDVDQHRKEEGLSLQKDLMEQVESIRKQLQTIAQLAPERMQNIRERIQKNLEELQTEHDANRFEQELIFYTEKLDINEELVRLENHLNYFSEIAEAPNSSGKKLGFIAQEIGREINTIGSKAQYAPMQKVVVLQKDALEKIKEQLLNVL
ncbi:MAG: YicC/YloC family endoribonuclease [Flavobacteriaceae bacterium]